MLTLTDGAQIAVLLSSVFINILPNLVKSGMVYILHSPLYGWKEGKEYKFANDMKDIPPSIRGNKQKYTRYKGLGEMDDDEYHEACMNKDNRQLIQLQYPNDINEFNDLMVNSSDKKDLLLKLGKIVKRESE